MTAVDKQNLKTILSSVLSEHLADAHRTVGTEAPLDATECLSALEAHMDDVYQWSETVRVFGAPDIKSTESGTVALTFQDLPQRFRLRSGGTTSTGSLLNEQELFDRFGSFAILGGPGAGKTTTLKRLFIQSLGGLVASDRRARPTILVRLREQDWNNERPNGANADSLAELCLTILGAAPPRIPRLSPDETKDMGSEEVEKEESRRRTALLELRARALYASLEESSAHVLLDGLDEIHPGRRDSLEEQIQRLAASTKTCRIVVSCRSGDYGRPLVGLHEVELSALAPAQVADIVGLWANDEAAFLRELSNSPLAELANRPLFLINILTIFNSSGYIPDQPSAVYERIVSLVIMEWDRLRHVHRRSKYAGFMAEQKLEFLSNLSYEISCEIRAKTFSRDTLVKVYQKIGPRYDLPSDEAIQVAQEIEAHNGLILQSGHNQYEFSHLTLQEYLCASYLVRAPFSDLFDRYLVDFPGPVALAVSLSSTPTTYLSHITRQNFRGSTQSLVSFLTRLIDERPRFEPDLVLAVSILQLLDKTELPISEMGRFDGLFDVPGVSMAFRDLFKLYVQKGRNPVEFVHRIPEDYRRKGMPDPFVVSRSSVDYVSSSVR